MTLGGKARPRSCEALEVKLRIRIFSLLGLGMWSRAVSKFCRHFRKIAQAAGWRVELKEEGFEA